MNPHISKFAAIFGAGLAALLAVSGLSADFVAESQLTQPDEVARLMSPVEGEEFSITAVDELTANQLTPLRFKPTRLWAPGAKVRVVDDEGARVIDPPRRNIFRAASASTHVLLVVDPETGDVSGAWREFGTTLTLKGKLGGRIEANSVVESAATPDQPEAFCEFESARQPLEAQTRFELAQSSFSLDAPDGAGILYDARVAVDTDNEWLAGKGGNTTTATNYIMDVFVTMNVFYERDLQTRLILGDVILRTGSGDPYASSGSTTDHLDEFAEEWYDNNGAIDRDFAILFSGRGIGSLSFSGVAWLDQYCENGFVGNVQGGGTVVIGSYANNRIGSSLSAAWVANFVGHELGHLFGSEHTHCYNPPVDQCYRAQSGCYSGPVSCPGGGNNPGTTMSYCHFGAPNGADCADSNQEFHPTVQTLIEGRIAANSPSCIAPHSTVLDPLFDDDFEN
jgi:hypothetical protein